MGLLGRIIKRNPQRVVIVGLDGVPFSLIRELSSMGLIPSMSSLFQKGYFGRMEVSLPEVSSVSWSSFMTGTQAGEHGIFGFMDLKPDSYRMTFPNFCDLKADTIWDELGRAGKRAVVINLPSTYPARPINGILISGFVAVDINRAVSPPSLIPKLKELGYSIDIDTMKARKDHRFLIKDLNRTLEARQRLVDYLWSREKWDLFMIVVTGTDRLNHYLWDALEEPCHPHHADFIAYYQKVDRFVGDLYRRYREIGGGGRQHHFIVLSDHGFTRVEKELYLNRWLQQEGYLSFSNDNPKSIEEIGPGTKAFAMDPSRIYIHLRERYPRGEVDRSDYEPLRAELKEKLEGLRFDGRAVLKRVYYREELYSGPHAHRGPDLVLLAHHGFDLKGATSRKEVFGRTDLTGMHTQDDAFFFSDQGVECKRIFDVKGIVLGAYR